MHGSLLLLVLLGALGMRCQWRTAPSQAWGERWLGAIIAFCLPPLMLLAAAVAVLWMGHHGSMLGMPVSPVSCWISRGILLAGFATLLYAMGRGFQTYRMLRTLPHCTLPTGDAVRCLAVKEVLAAQVGIWRSQILVSEGFLTQLDADEMEAILQHERAHYAYRDPFWFFWLGWLRRLTGWMPNTQALWQELLLLREVRADHRAAQVVDPLLLAELLLKLTVATSTGALPCQVTFSHPDLLGRLEQRVDALLSPDPITFPTPFFLTAWMLLSLVPLTLVVLHH